MIHSHQMFVCECFCVTLSYDRNQIKMHAHQRTYERIGVGRATAVTYLPCVCVCVCPFFHATIEIADKELTEELREKNRSEKNQRIKHCDIISVINKQLLELEERKYSLPICLWVKTQARLRAQTRGNLTLQSMECSVVFLLLPLHAF